MATVLLTSTEALGSHEDAFTTLTMNVPDIVNGNHFVATGKDLLVIHNTDVAEKWITITSVANKWGRLGTITALDIAIDGYVIFGPMVVAGWASDGLILITAEDADTLIGVVNL